MVVIFWYQSLHWQDVQGYLVKLHFLSSNSLPPLRYLNDSSENFQTAKSLLKERTLRKSHDILLTNNESVVKVSGRKQEKKENI